MQATEGRERESGDRRQVAVVGSYLEVRNYLSRVWAASRPPIFTRSIMMSRRAQQRRERSEIAPLDLGPGENE